LHQLSRWNLFGSRELIELHELYWGILFYIRWSNLGLYFDLLLGYILCCRGERVYILCFWHLPGLDCTVELHTLRGRHLCI